MQYRAHQYLPNQITSSCGYCTQRAPTCSKQMNVAMLCIDIQNVLYWAMAQLQHQISKGLCAHCITVTQATCSFTLH